MNKKLIDIIVTHYNEPWDVCKGFFDMLSHQRVADMDKVNIILVQDGEENTLDWNSLLANYQYHVIIDTISHAGTASARNKGLQHAESDWVMFCDIDDFFGDVCSLSMLLSQLPTDSCDIIWGKYAMEMIWRRGLPYIQAVTKQNFMNTTCKLYRKQVLDEKQIRFDPDFKYAYEYVFNAICLSEIQPFRVREFTTEFYSYFKTYRKNSLRSTKEYYLSYMTQLFYANVRIADELASRGYADDACQFYFKAMCDVYYSIHDPETGNDPAAHIKRDVLTVLKKRNDEIFSVSESDKLVLIDETESIAMSTIQHLFNEHKLEYYLKDDAHSFDEWIGSISCDTQDEHENAMQHEELPLETEVVNLDNRQHEDASPRVVVYCGTENVYGDMIASCKSLLCNTPVDKVYFLCEDDVFPHELPDIVETINVKDQQYFTHDGPNFDSAWTYMCMMRAVYPEMFSQYDKVLSLDIDIIINDDISDLWNYDMSEYFLAGVPEKQRQKTPDDPIYINFGVVMMNLDMLRQHNIQQEIVSRLNTVKTDCPEQTAYNEACAYHILELSPEYNTTVYSHITCKTDKERVLHYAGQTFWKQYANVKKYSSLSWDEVMRRQNALKGG